MLGIEKHIIPETFFFTQAQKKTRTNKLKVDFTPRGVF